jgi:hypothetical protein
MIVAIGGVANISTLPDTYDNDRITGYWLFDDQGKGERVTGFFMKGTNAERICKEASGVYDGRGTPETVFVVKGIAHQAAGYPKAAFFIESIEKFESAAIEASARLRPPGRDWFVRAGSAGGDGTREQPLKDPWQALEKCESGDTIHVAQGEYFGKLKVGRWQIDTSYIALIGGYDQEFRERNPWTHPTLLFCPEDFKGTRGGYTIEGTNDHTGAIVDGFIFDKRPNNEYLPNGDIHYDRSDKSEHIWLNRPECVIRNCVFLNGVAGALRVCNGQVIENNIFINHWSKTIVMTKGHTFDPSVIRNNTLLFSWDLKFGEGSGRGGHLLRLETDVRAIVDNNIFEFADNDAIQLALEPSEIVLTNNVFSHNLWSVAQKMMAWTVVDESNFKQLGDLGLKRAEGNQLMTAGIPLDQAWFDVYLNRTAYVPGKVTMDDWNKLREVLGQPVIATGGQGPEGMMPLYDWKKAIALFPRNPECTAGARAFDLEVRFTGIARLEESFQYEPSTWDVAKDRDSWDRIDGKRVSLEVAIRGADNQYLLDGVKEAEYQCFMVCGPKGTDSGGLPLRCYLKKGTRFERVMSNARDFATGTPEETYLIQGIPRSNRQMIVEVIERAN